MNTPYTDIRFRRGETPGVRYISGNIVYDEMLSEGRLVTRYWSPNGQVLPEMHLERLRWREDQPADSFRLCVDGQDLAGGYVWESAVTEPDPSIYRARCGEDGKPLVVAQGAVGEGH